MSRQQLYNDVAAGVTLAGNYRPLVFLAAIRLVPNDMTIIIGAMLLARESCGSRTRRWQ